MIFSQSLKSIFQISSMSEIDKFQIPTSRWGNARSQSSGDQWKHQEAVRAE